MVLTRSFRCPTSVIEGQKYTQAVDACINNRPWVLITSSGWLKREAVNISKFATSPLAIFADVMPNPKISNIIDLGKNMPTVKVVVALGGGSVIDAAKGAIALKALKGNRSILMAHLRNNVPLPKHMDPAQLVAVPTTSGTGSEVTQWGTLWGDDKVKHSVSDPRLYPKHAILDPSLCTSMPSELTISSALDALSHAMESVWNKHHTSLSDELATNSISLIRKYLSLTLGDPDNIEFRKYMQTASIISGLAMGTTQTALAHSISYPFTAKLGLPHGFACSFTLAEVARYNLKTSSERLRPIAQGLGCSPNCIPEIIEKWLCDLGVGETIDKFVSDDFINKLDDSIISRARTANNIRDIDARLARDIALTALNKLSKSKKYEYK